ncbi:plasmid stabilization protein [Burkholderia sp. SRS-46]|nr:plasmid stabilization protein [Burkholderia sp. SRS-46]
MTLDVVILRSAQADLKALKRYILSNFGTEVWQVSYGKIKDAIAVIQSFPDRGWIPDELVNIDLTQYRQVAAGMNRVIYEVRGHTAFIHIVCGTRKDLKSILMSRLLRAD